MNQNKFFLPSLILPIAALLFLTVFKAYSLQSGLRFILPISGYDPVNPISGHYVTYRVDYGNDTCQDDSFKNDQESCICLKLGEAATHYYVPNCQKTLLKDCDAIDKTVRKGKSKIKISVTKDGKAIVEDLILVDE